MVPSKTLQAWLLSLLATRALGAVHEMLAAAPSGWQSTGAADDSTPVVLQIGLAEKNIDQLESKLMSVSDPRSPQYGNHFSKDDVESLFPPQDGAVDAVTAWLKSNGVSKISTQGSWVNFATDVATANKLLDTKFAHYSKEGTSKLRTTQYSVPDDLQKHIDLITPTTYFGNVKANLPAAYRGEDIRREFQSRPDEIDSSCSNLITPSCIKQLYNINYTPKATSGSKIGFGSFLNQSARVLDLSGFESKYKLPAQNFTNVLINGGVNDQAIDDNHGEADLDVEYIVGTAGPLPVTQFLTGGSPPFIPDINEPTENENEPYLPYYQYLLAQDDLPQVISNSYGDDEQTVPLSYAVKVCNLIGKMGMRGISVLESSGDTGVGAGCKTNDGKNTTTYIPTFPASCPYVTSVGGLQSVSPEIAWVASSGGFSNYFPRPSFQNATYAAYVQTPIGAKALADYGGKYANFSGRGFPDVSAHSLTPDFSVIYNGQAALSGGTSAAGPVFSSVIALLNDALLRAGKKQLGFLNPLLYSEGFASKALNDIVGGASVGCNGINGQSGQPVPGGGIVPGAAWNATTGWDPSTGLGSPDFGKMKSVVLGG